MSANLTNKTDEELKQLMRDSIDNAYAPSSIYHKANLELKFRADKNNPVDSTIFRTTEQALNLRKQSKKGIPWKESVIGTILLGVIIGGINYYLFPSNSSGGTVQITGDNNIIGNNNIQEIKEKKVEFTEYVFVNNYCYITAIVDSKSKVIAYSVTTRKADFNPEIKPYDGLSIKLGKNRFSEIPEKYDKNEGNVGARTFYYKELYYFGNQGNYAYYIFAINDAGYLKINSVNDLSFLNPEFIEREQEKLSGFRENAYINTFVVTSPFTALDRVEKITAGPFTDQIKLIDGKEDVVNKQQIIGKLQKLFPDSNIDYFKKILGDPQFINSINL